MMNVLHMVVNTGALNGEIQGGIFLRNSSTLVRGKAFGAEIIHAFSIKNRRLVQILPYLDGKS